MTKTICDICGKEIPSIKFVDPNEKRVDFTISSHEKVWDICDECKLGIYNSMTIMRKQAMKEERE